MPRRRSVVVVTGAAGGIGTATVGLFREEGWEVVGVDRAFAARPGRSSLRADVGEPAQVRRLVALLRTRYGRLDALVNSAAEQICKPLVAHRVDEWDRIMASNLRSVYLLVVGCHPLLRAATGCIVNVASVHALATSRGLAAYTASKGGVAALTRAMALEFARDGIRVNAVLPGAVATPMLTAGLRRGHLAGSRGDSAAMAALARRHPMGRIGRPRDVAHAIRFLADSERAAFITGQLLIVDGGATSRLSTE